MSATERPAIPVRQGWFTRLLRLRRGPWEAVATTVIAAGVLMLMQSFWIVLYSWSFLTILAGTAMFVIVSHFRD